MSRLILLGLIIGLIVYFYKRQIKASEQNSTYEANLNPNENIEDMVQCAKCSIHLPRSEAYMVKGEFFCTKGHIQ